MGLSKDSTGARAAGSELVIEKKEPGDLVLALAGNPNVGKSTVFNALTGMHQHTGNWPGKTVTNAQGYVNRQNQGYVLVDLPGCYSLLAHSAEEEVARDFLCFGGADAAVVVCDATCLERNLNLVLQAMEITPRVVVCVNLLDEARRKGVKVHLEKLSELLGVPVVGASARSGTGLEKLLEEAGKSARGLSPEAGSAPIPYSPFTEEAVAKLQPVVEGLCGGRVNARWLALKLLDSSDTSLDLAMEKNLGLRLRAQPEVREILEALEKQWEKEGLTPERLRDDIAAGAVGKAEELARQAVSFGQHG